MGNTLLVAEKPKSAWRIAQAIGNPITKEINGVKYYEVKSKGENITVVPAVGHLLILKQKNKGWTYPVFDVEWKEAFKINKKAKFTEKYYKAIKKLGEKAETFINGCDYDIEGSVIGRNVIHYICNGEDDKIKRMRFSTLTYPELKKSFENLEEYDKGQTEAGILRHILDWFWGINTSRALILALKRNNRHAVLSIGRVQGPALSILACREREIREFVPKPYWQILLISGKIKAIYKERRIFEKDKAERIYHDCKGENAAVSKIEKIKYKIFQPTPFNLTDLQKEAYRIFRIGPSQTLNIAQNLYLNGLISYPRTASQKLPPVIGYKKIMQNLSKNGYEKQVKLLDLNNLRPREGKKSDAHPALFPTGQKPEKLNLQEKKIYDLIVKRFLACFSVPCIRENVKIILKIKEHEFISETYKTVEKGWTEIYSYINFKEGEFPELEEGQILNVDKLELKEKETEPPERYTPASIISELESRNLGTKSTRSEIIDSLYARKYIKGIPIEVTDLGMKIVEIMEKFCADIISEKLSRSFEMEMEKVMQNKKKKEKVIEEAKTKLSEILNNLKIKEKEIGREILKALIESDRKERFIGKCTKCNGTLRIVVSKKSGKRFVGCSEFPKGCRVAFPLPQKGKIKALDKTCNACNSPMISVISRKKFITCINPNCQNKEIQ